MVRSLQSFSLYICKAVSSQQLRAKSTRRFVTKYEDRDDLARKKKQDQQGHLHLNKGRGQHLLMNPRILDSIVRKSNVKSTDTVLEVGPGTGNLTLKLLEAAEKVVAVEIDKRMVEVLSNRVAEHGFIDKLTITCADALRTDFPPFDLVVANIPYGISSPLVAKLVFGKPSFRSATLLLQKEFARRLLAKPGDSEFNRLAVNVKLVADVEFVMDVSKRDFLPCPKVNSSVVIIRPKAEIPDVDMNEWLAFTRTCFSKKNKTLGATFKQKRKLMELLRICRGTKPEEVDSIDGHSCDIQDNDEDEEQEVEDNKMVNDDVDDDDDISSSSEAELGLFKQKIVGVLASGGFEDKRPLKLSHNELLHLLSLFNQAGIYFTEPAKTKGAAEDFILDAS